MYKIYIFMQCAPNPYEFFQSIFGLRALSKCVLRAHIWTCCKVNSDQPSAAGVTAESEVDSPVMKQASRQTAKKRKIPHRTY